MNEINLDLESLATVLNQPKPIKNKTIGSQLIELSKARSAREALQIIGVVGQTEEQKKVAELEVARDSVWQVQLPE